MVMTRQYARLDQSGMDRFTDAQFLVFLNRFCAFLLSGLCILVFWSDQPVHTPPLYKYSFASFSNIISSWCQYEALKYVTFPAQTICKASKVIPVMLMGKLVSGNKYPTYQYCTALLLVFGVSLFLLFNDSLASHSSSHSVQSTTVSGVVLMCGYLLFDSFTPNWQAKLYSYEPRVSSFQMMCGVNACSVLLTSLSLFEQGSMWQSLTFLVNHENIFYHCFLLSLFGTVGQIFIFKTIDQFGPVVFTIIMTIRQMVSIVVSCLYYGHRIGPGGFLGLIFAFTALFLNQYLRQSVQVKKATTIVRRI